MTGHMLHGVSCVQIESDEGPVAVASDGRVYLWSSGAVTVYADGQPWRVFPERRVLAIIGRESG